MGVTPLPPHPYDVAVRVRAASYIRIPDVVCGALAGV